MEQLNYLYTNQRTGNHSPRKVSRSDFQRDYDRIIFSSSFRRLQNKTQVFPLPGSVFVHNRLTHSLEVSSVGRSLGTLAGEFINDNFKKNLSEESSNFYLYDLQSVIAAACLCHDVGNPAFGHSGEDAIASYFEKNESELKNIFTEKEWADFTNFEGNANAIRILTHQQNGKDEGGVQLTHTTLSAIAKYPCEAIAKKKGYVNRKKFGFFQNEKEIFTEIATNTAMKMESSEPLVYKRNPFVWLVEMADDICYNIIDMEDAHRLGIISTSDCESLFLEVIKETTNNDLKRIEKKLLALQNQNEKISYLRAKLIGSLIASGMELYKANFQAIVEGSHNLGILDMMKKNSPSLDKIEKFSQSNIYNHRSVVEIENAGYNVMYELLDHFIPPVLKPKDDRKGYEKKALQLMPSQFHYDNGTTYQKVLGVLDFVSGMTDNFATDIYRKIKGIDIGMTV
ncbi:MAG: dNTP triphosphohydrolase [Bacteroidetes bacterium]|jgi:dGTPase|nr:dNTP triphosphohydrolase [Bacteroidota bacterium]